MPVEFYHKVDVAGQPPMLVPVCPTTGPRVAWAPGIICWCIRTSQVPFPKLRPFDPRDRKTGDLLYWGTPETAEGFRVKLSYYYGWHRDQGRDDRDQHRGPENAGYRRRLKRERWRQVERIINNMLKKGAFWDETDS